MINEAKYGLIRMRRDKRLSKVVFRGEKNETKWHIPIVHLLALLFQNVVKYLGMEVSQNKIRWENLLPIRLKSDKYVATKMRSYCSNTINISKYLK